MNNIKIDLAQLMATIAQRNEALRERDEARAEAASLRAQLEDALAMASAAATVQHLASLADARGREIHRLRAELARR